jgi:hypothetical protein
MKIIVDRQVIHNVMGLSITSGKLLLSASPCLKVCCRLGVKIYLVLVCIFISLSPPGASEAVAFPYELNCRNEIVLGVTGFSTLGLSVYLDRDTRGPDASEIERLKRGDINYIDRSATDNWSEEADRASDVLLLATVISPSLLVVSYINEREWYRFITIVIMYSEAVLINTGVTRTVKSLAGRKRPYLYNDSLSTEKRVRYGKSSVKSFYSGHTSLAFCSAVFLSKTWGDIHPNSYSRYLVWGVSLTAASATGYLRYTAGQHYPTDIVVGAVMGGIIGYMVPVMHRVHGDGITVQPLLGDMKGIACCFRLNFF